jgi:hypothetical protein
MTTCFRLLRTWNRRRRVSLEIWRRFCRCCLRVERRYRSIFPGLYGPPSSTTRIGRLPRRYKMALLRAPRAPEAEEAARLRRAREAVGLRRAEELRLARGAVGLQRGALLRRAAELQQGLRLQAARGVCCSARLLHAIPRTRIYALWLLRSPQRLARRSGCWLRVETQRGLTSRAPYLIAKRAGSQQRMLVSTHARCSRRRSAHTSCSAA